MSDVNKNLLLEKASDAIKKNDFDELKKLIDQGMDINFFDNKNQSLLWCACQQGNVDAVKWLIEHGADVNIRINDGFTPLVLAAQTNIEIVQLLLEAGADVNAGNELNLVAAIYSVITRREDTFHLLMQAGTDINFLFNKEIEGKVRVSSLLRLATNISKNISTS